MKVKKKNSMGLSVFDFFTLLPKGGEGGGVSSPCSAHLEPSQGHRSLLRQHTRLLLRHLLCGILNVPHYRVDRALGFFSSRPNWDPPPAPQASVGGKAHLLDGVHGGGLSQFRRGYRHCGTLGTYVLGVLDALLPKRI